MKRLVFLFLVIACISPEISAQESLPSLVRRIKPSAVAIETFDARGEKLSRGSGFFIDIDRVVPTFAFGFFGVFVDRLGRLLLLTGHRLLPCARGSGTRAI